MIRRTLALVATLAVLGFGTPARATDTRLQSMGGAHRVYTVPDEAAAWLFPSTLVLFPNVVWVEGGVGWPADDEQGNPEPGIRNNTTAADLPYNAAGGIHLALGKNGVLGVWASSLSRNVSPGALGWALASWNETDGIPGAETDGDVSLRNADHKGSLAYAHRIGKARLGVLLSVWGDAYKVKSPATERVERGGLWVEGRLGAGFDFGTRSSADLALGFHYGSFKDDLVPGSGGTALSTRLKADASWGLALDARSRLEAFGNFVVPYLALDFGGDGVAWNEKTPDAPEVSGSTVALAAGVDFLITPLENFHIVPGVGLGYGMDLLKGGETVRDDSDLVIPYYGVGLDARVVKWLALRFGLTQAVVFSKEEGVTEDRRTHDVVTRLRTGFGLEFGNVSMDFLLNPTFWTGGPSALFDSGSDLAAQFALRATW
ncbi:MAG: hypothetical protein FJ098_12590 [Deltaproteobacteria bacterium]|nr:hypothetical protein [Deltaproteobacteria bacterium]